MSQYAKDIQKARDDARKRDRYTCQITRLGHHTGHSVDGAHLFPTRSPFPRYDPRDVKFVITLYREVHQVMDAIKNHIDRAQWLRHHDLDYCADLILWVVGEIEEEPLGARAA